MKGHTHQTMHMTNHRKEPHTPEMRAGPSPAHHITDDVPRSEDETSKTRANYRTRKAKFTTSIYIHCMWELSNMACRADSTNPQEGGSEQQNDKTGLKTREPWQGKPNSDKESTFKVANRMALYNTKTF